MNFFVQMMVGVAVGVLGYLLLRPIANQPHTSTRHKHNNDAYYEPPGKLCPICLDEMQNGDMRYLPCHHAMHERCYRECRRNNYRKCPTCRKDF